MQKKKNEFWAFFASVKLALFTFFILAIASIIGTLIPQGKEMQYYVDAFGPGTAKLFQMLNVPDMYNSWWFVALLVLFSINLIVCTIDRFPNIWRLVTMDNLALDIDRIVKMPRPPKPPNRLSHPGSSSRLKKMAGSYWLPRKVIGAGLELSQSMSVSW